MEPVNFATGSFVLLQECAKILPDKTSLYQVWLTSGEEVELLWSPLLNITIEQQKQLLYKYLLSVIFRNFGHISLKSEYQLKNFVQHAEQHCLRDLSRKCSKLKHLRKLGIADPVSVNLSIADVLISHNLPPNIINENSRLLSRLKQSQTTSLDFIFDHVLETKHTEHIIMVARAHLHHQLISQLFNLPMQIINQLPIQYVEGNYHLQKIQFQLSDEVGHVKNVILTLPSCCPWTDKLISYLRRVLLTYWATKRVAWLLLNTAQLPNELEFFCEPPENIQYLIKAMLQQSCEQLLQRNPTVMEKCILQLCKSNIYQTLKMQLYARANDAQMQVLQRLSMKYPNEFNAALLFGPGTPACKTSLLRLTGTWSTDGQTLKTLQ